MIKGWRNNPEWVKFYAEKKEKLLAFEKRSIQLEWKIKAIEKMQEHQHEDEKWIV